MLEVRDLTVEVPGRSLMAKVSFDCKAGSSIAIVGPSGSGKTSLLNTIAGIRRPSAGEVRLSGECISRLPDARASAVRLRQMGLVFQFPELFPELSAVENAALALQLRGARKRDALRVARMWLVRLGVGGIADAAITRLSGGEAQRVGIARAFCGEPRLVLADEPTGSLDQSTALQIADLLYATAHKAGAGARRRNPQSRCG